MKPPDFDNDFGSILHHHSQTLMRLFLSLTPVMNYLGDDPFEGEVTSDEIDTALIAPVQALSIALDKVFSHIGHGWEARGISNEIRLELDDVRAEIVRYVDQPPDLRFRPPFLQTLVSRLESLLLNQQQYKVAREVLRELRQASKEVQRIICLYELKNTSIRLLDMEQQTKALRDFYLRAVRIEEVPKPLKVSSLIKEAIHELEAYAKAKRIRIDFINKAANSRIDVRYKETLRAFANILHNAIKYNFTLRGPQMAWVKIEAVNRGELITVRFENWGVPIERDEILSGLIFKPGWRGTYARLKDWTGNGIGLAEAKRAIDTNYGTIKIDSTPAVPQGPSSNLDYSKPFVTVVTVQFPASRSS